MFWFLFTVFVILFSFLFLHHQKKLRNLAALNAPIVPKTNWPILGQTRSLHEYIMFKNDLQNYRIFGQSYCMQVGASPIFYTVNPEILREVIYKQADKFSAQRKMFQGPDKYNYLFLAGGEKWKQARKLLTPAFTSGKINKMMEHMDIISDRFIEHIKTIPDRSQLDIRPLFERNSLEVLSKCLFGMEVGSYPVDKLSEAITKVLARVHVPNFVANIVVRLAFAFPKFFSILNEFFIVKDASDYLYNLTISLVERKKEMGVTQTDNSNLLDVLINMEKYHRNEILTKDMILAQGAAMFVAGFETTSSALSSMAFNLSKHPEVQKQLFTEIEECMKKNDNQFVIDDIINLPYLEACINENLRCFAPIIRLSRTTGNEEVQVGKHKFTPGTQVVIPLYTMHYNPEYYAEPHVFNPARFIQNPALSKNRDAFAPFGGGSRTCVGSQFAMRTMKITLAKLVLNFELVDLGPHITKMEFVGGNHFLSVFHEILVKLKLRS